MGQWLTGLLISLLTAAALSGCGVLSLPSGEGRAEIVAEVRLDGKAFAGRSVWLIKSQTQNGWHRGINYWVKALGDAVVFDLGGNSYLFMHPNHHPVMDCADLESPEIQDRSIALSSFRGECDARRSGWFTYLPDASVPVEEMEFVDFGYRSSGELIGMKGNPANDSIIRLQERGFEVSSLLVKHTRERLGIGMTERFPWILELDRTDVCGGRYRGEDASCWTAGVTYAQYFTTDLPRP
jgi:hypothetical protein